MPSNPSKRGVNITMSSEERAAVEAVAKERGFKSVSEYIRSLIENDTQKLPVPIRFAMAWGGRRERLKDDEE